MNLVVGTLLYQSDLEVFSKCVAMLIRQSIRFLNPDFRLTLLIQDNDSGAQLDELRTVIARVPGIEKLDMRVFKSENRGFAAGHNALFSVAENVVRDFDYYICINPDGIPHYRMLEEMLKLAVSNDNKGIYEARQFPVEHSKWFDAKTGKTDWCAASCMLIPRNIMQEMGGFDDLFFIYMEDVDLSWRVKLAGYNCFTVNDAVFFNDSARSNLDNHVTEKLILISALKLAKKYDNKIFYKVIYDMLAKQVSFADIQLLKEEIEGIFKSRDKPLPKLAIKPRFINFQSGLSFAATRW